MRIEWLATGDEIMAGGIADTNGAWLGETLAREGFLLARGSSAGDSREELTAAITEISRRAGVAIVCGGLGPTEDDITAEVAAALLQVELEIHRPSVERLKKVFAKFKYPLTENNLRSVRAPKGTTVLVNPAGTAPGFQAKIGSAEFFFLPGPPREFRPMAERDVLPFLRSQARPGFAQLILKTIGYGESQVETKLADLVAAHREVTFGYRACFPEIWVKLSATAEDRDKAAGLVEPVAGEVARIQGSSVFGREADTLPGVVHRALIAQRRKLATAESCTGGLIAHLLTALPGASDYFVGGVVAYSNELKKALLGVSESTLAAHGAVSGECVAEMAAGARERYGADFAVAVSGVAGPSGGTADKPVGLVCHAVAAAEGVVVLERRFPYDREGNQRAAALVALEMLRRRLLGLENFPGTVKVT